MKAPKISKHENHILEREYLKLIQLPIKFCHHLQKQTRLSFEAKIAHKLKNRIYMGQKF